MIVCISVVGRNNNPLYLRIYHTDTSELKLQFIVHTSLDIFEEKLKESSSLNGSYLGLLYPTEDFKVFGYITNTNVKLVAVVDDSDARDAEMRSFFEKFHNYYVLATCNPFYKIGEEITSQKFSTFMDKLISSR